MQIDTGKSQSAYPTLVTFLREKLFSEYKSIRKGELKRQNENKERKKEREKKEKKGTKEFFFEMGAQERTYWLPIH